MFSDAINSISSRWRPSSLRMASKTSGSASASGVANSESATAFAEDSDMDMRRSRDGLGLPYRGKCAKGWMPAAHSRNMLIWQALFAGEPSLELLQRQPLQVGLGGARRAD